jgi:hypothetical protein
MLMCAALLFYKLLNLGIKGNLLFQMEDVTDE